MGLSISRRLVQMMGGEIGVESREGQGSRFWFSAAFQNGEESEVLPAPVPPDIVGQRILIVDDNHTNRTILVKMVESFGCSAQAVQGGPEAIEAMRRAVEEDQPFSMVLLDMQMPGMDGEKTLRALRDDPKTKDVPVVILTSAGGRGDCSRLEEAGCAGYIVKPVKQSQLFDVVITVLSRRGIKTRERYLPMVTRHTIEEHKRRMIRILLAEDNPTNQKLAVTLLKKSGYSVDAVENGRMTVAVLRRAAYDLVLMDVQMPEMDGFEATKAIREMEGEAKHTPIVAMTAHAMSGDRERCLRAGMDDYVSKPIEPQTLIQTIEKWTKPGVRTRAALPETRPQKGHRREDAPLDIKDAMRRFDGDEEFLHQMLREFLSSAPKLLETLEEAVESNDNQTVERQAHSLKGAASNLSAKRTADLAHRLELSGRQTDLSGAKELIRLLRSELARLRESVFKAQPQGTARTS